MFGDRWKYFECVHQWIVVPTFANGHVVRKSRICKKCGHGMRRSGKTAYNTQTENSNVGTP